MQNVSIIGKFLTIFALFSIFALGVAGYSTTQMKAIDGAYSDLIAFRTESALALQGANRSLQTGRAAMADMMIAFTDEGNGNAVKEVAANREAFSLYMDKAIGLMPSVEELMVLKSEGLAVFDRACTNAIELGSTALSVDEALASQRVFGQECQPVFSKVGQKFVETVKKISESNIAESDYLTTRTNSIAIYSLFGMIGGFLIVFMIGFIAIRSWVTLPIWNLAAIMKTLAEGDLTVSVPNQLRRDEVGRMANAVQVFKDNGLAAAILAKNAETIRRDAEALRQQTDHEERVRTQAMAQATSGLAHGLKHLAAGDLSFRLTEPFAANFEALRSDFNGAASQLAEALRAVTDATGAIDNGSREVSESAEDLSKRTEQQAAALEETAAALDQITANVTSASDRVEGARQVAIQANQSAVHSGHVVSKAVAAMRKIEQSSNQISNIIGVIDEIAFQTNLLALNAGVEAARAGEAGKGFAVVAQEVRELAQRSAQAAKEIKDLIRSSSLEVQNGVKIVRDTGEALKTIEGYIVSVNNHMDAIAVAAKEQAVGLAEVNIAVNQMDQVTQQNAAMVEETSAAGASLASESRKLKGLVSRFQFGKGESETSFISEASQTHQAVQSPARRMTGDIAKAFLGKVAIKERWENF
ncbi:HAMP domain-containing protein (plasmid) [Rhizobium sp. NIBRBAC000502774]|nr:HAMP domain-containing protein [Rhizobium sp. NIBRBAC000502774]